VVRYNADGPAALGDLRRHNGARARVLTPQILERLLLRLRDPPDDGGVSTSKKVTAFLAGELGLVSVGMQRGRDDFSDAAPGKASIEAVRRVMEINFIGALAVT
jgi:hypothetical protein